MASRRLVTGLTLMVVLVTGLELKALAEPPPPPDSMGHNGLSSDSLFHNPLTMNPTALAILLGNPLNDNTLKFKDGYLTIQLLDLHAQDVMADLVACAFDRLTHVGSWSGEVGLCPKDTSDDWSARLPSNRCLQLVSACLLARVNGLHRRVPLSLHGPGGILLMKKRFLIEQRYRESFNAGLSGGTLIPSFSDHILKLIPPFICAQGDDCGWKPEYVGKCVPKLTITIKGPQGCKLSTRVCRGIYGCRENDTTVNPKSALFYSGRINPQVDNNCSVQFVCPEDGSYGVMSKPASRGTLSPDSGTYPAHEDDVFRFREAAFFGNLFDPNGLTTPEGVTRTQEVRIGSNGNPQTYEVITSVDRTTRATSTTSMLWPPKTPVPLVVPYQNVYACHPDLEQSQQADTQIANLNDRVCARPNPDKNVKCFPHPITGCSSDGCTWSDKHKAYSNCKGNNRVSDYLPITTYLDDPCSLIDQDQCIVNLHK